MIFVAIVGVAFCSRGAPRSISIDLVNVDTNAEVVMNIKKRVDNNIPFSLHDSRIIKISAEAERLTLTFDKVYEYNGDNEKSYPATMLFEGIDYEECDVIVFDSELGYGSFTGTRYRTRYRMREFVDKFPNGIFEIITETYSGYDTVFRGYI